MATSPNALLESEMYEEPPKVPEPNAGVSDSAVHATQRVSPALFGSERHGLEEADIGE